MPFIKLLMLSHEIRLYVLLNYSYQEVGFFEALAPTLPQGDSR